jgi:eukaryotic-like serine/threonine-protein kinase
MDDSSNDPRVGSVLQERYRILERLAVGSMGIVYRAERLLLGRPLAVKFLHASYAADPTFIQRFERETRVMGRLAHPHCVSVIDFGVDGGPYVVMEFVAGNTLRSLLEGGRPPVERAVHITRQTLAGLAHAHSLGIIHRDIKPANIMLMDATGTGDHVCILDFGLATLREAHSADISHSAIVIGTPNYMSPEQSVGGKADVRSDVYSTGVVLFELLTGRKPFTSEDTFELLSMHRSAPIPRLTNVAPDTDFPRGMQEVIDRALAKAPDDRFQTAMEFAAALDKTRQKGREKGRDLPARKVERVRRATRPVPVDDKNESSQPADYRRSLGVARSSAMPAQRRRRGVSLFAAAIALALVGGAAWGGYKLWNSEVGARLRAMIERPPPEAPGSSGALAPASDEPVDTASKGIAPGAKDEGASASEAKSSGAQDEGEPAKQEAAQPEATTDEPAGAEGGAGAEPAGDPSSDPASGSATDSASGEASDAAKGATDPAKGATEPAKGATDPAKGAAEPAKGATEPAKGAATGGAGAVTSQAEEALPDEPPLPAEEREEPVAPVGDAMVDSEPDGAERQSAELDSGPPTDVDTVPEAVALIRAGKRQDAIRALVALRRKMPKSAYVPYLLGNLYFEKGWWTLGMDYYEAAIRQNQLYGGKRILNENVIRALGGKKTRKKAARMFVNSIGRSALPFLRKAARTDRDPQVRDWSGWLVWRLTQLSRKRSR